MRGCLGSLGIAIVADIGLPSAMTMMINSFRDQIPLLLTTVTTTRADAGRGTFPQEYDFQEDMLGPMTTWRWVVRRGGDNPGIDATRAQIRDDGAGRAGVPLYPRQRAQRHRHRQNHRPVALYGVDEESPERSGRDEGCADAA